MKQREYRTITGRRFDLNHLTNAERSFLADVNRRYEKAPGWSEFGSWWATEFKNSPLPQESVAYRICQDLEARLGIAQGTVAPPDYRDYVADLIEERYGSRYRFCRETGVDPGHLSRVFASRSELSLQSLQKILQKLHATLVIQPQDVVEAEASPKRAAEALAAAAR
jgi:transcriptional regulator with XRE-family HTH domain